MFTPRRVERRKRRRKTSFPLVSEDGKLVDEDRRCNPDRRTGNAAEELVEAGDHGFIDAVWVD